MGWFDILLIIGWIWLLANTGRTRWRSESLARERGRMIEAIDWAVFGGPLPPTMAWRDGQLACACGASHRIVESKDAGKWARAHRCRSLRVVA